MLWQPDGACCLTERPSGMSWNTSPFRSLVHRLLFGLYLSLVMPLVLAVVIIACICLIVTSFPIARVLAFTVLLTTIVAVCVGRLPLHSNIRLSAGGDVIRLLEVLPGDKIGPMRCRIVEGHWHTSKYETLGYTWDCECVWDKQCFIDNGVTPTLERAPRAMRRVDSVKTVWIDALCMNQREALRCTRCATSMNARKESLFGLMWTLGPNIRLDRSNLRST
ncbi:hypothetical protein BU25DRAFT_21907 [Macroventuria anomochaeta]|uniref:Uncharacterized protein n=1 Tax=Macroventuria anomochaeta TaxID=301207 RepID=A0ACB6S593_9PLEO|nr:uncharacterized protein BU25DRAFT_21907 [Macroventuria anomochaeta]KAF2629436.1 hypothetical protein BU25DRAFT_21907 [Macroventuria anomochaeta]